MTGLNDWLIGLAGQLNEMLRASLRIRHDPVWLAPGPGGPPEPGPVGLRLTLLALHPSAAARTLPHTGGSGGADAAPPPPFHLDAHLMVTAVAEPRLYVEALKFLSLAMRRLHDHPVLTENELQLETPGTLAIELADLPLDQFAALLAAHPTGGMPFALYRLRGMEIGAGATAMLMGWRYYISQTHLSRNLCYRPSESGAVAWHGQYPYMNGRTLMPPVESWRN